jgi:hypothetical protein
MAEHDWENCDVPQCRACRASRHPIILTEDYVVAHPEILRSHPQALTAGVSERLEYARVFSEIPEHSESVFEDDEAEEAVELAAYKARQGLDMSVSMDDCDPEILADGEGEEEEVAEDEEEEAQESGAESEDEPPVLDSDSDECQNVSGVIAGVFMNSRGGNNYFRG